jgi:uncharacterized phage infection (PIP) family protein YhgE
MTWASEHWPQLVGWTAVATFLSYIYQWAKNLGGYATSLTATRDDLGAIKSNHIPHLQKELEMVNQRLETVNTNLEGIREDFRDGINRLSDSINVLLTRL